jgi:hypothetical protein
MANEYTLHPTRSRVAKVQENVRPAFTEEQLAALTQGWMTAWAVHVEHDMNTCEWSITKVEPWHVYSPVRDNAWQHGILQVYGRDEVDAYVKTQKALAMTDPCEKR